MVRDHRKNGDFSDVVTTAKGYAMSALFAGPEFRQGTSAVEETPDIGIP
jgi:hypothetical protein